MIIDQEKKGLPVFLYKKNFYGTKFEIFAKNGLASQIIDPKKDLSEMLPNSVSDKIINHSLHCRYFKK